MQYSVGDKLIFVLSHRGTMPLRDDNGFLAAYDRLVEDHLLSHPRQSEEGIFPSGWEVLRDLAEMGFLRRVNEKVVVEAPCLVKCADRRNLAILTGARTQGIIEGLKRYAPTAIGTKTDVCMPSHINLSATDVELSKLAVRMGFVFVSQPLAYQMALRSRSIQDPDHGLTFQHTVLEGAREWFNATSLRFDGNPPTRVGQYGLAKIDYHGIRFDLYRSCADHIEVCADVGPAVGKWVVISQTGRMLAYDSSTRRLAVPHFAHLPSDLARALGLCACSRPIIRRTDVEQGETCPLRVYEGVPPVIARLVSEKLGCSLEGVNLETMVEMTCKTLLELSTRFATTS